MGKEATHFLTNLGKVADSDSCASQALALGVERGFIPRLERAVDEAGGV